MKIDKVYINKEGAPMVSRNGWPDLDITDVGINAIRAAKRDAVPLDTSHEQTARSLVLPITICDSFIDVEIEVEFVDQYKNYDWKMWEDCDDRGTKPWHLLRTIARVVPEKAENGAHSYTEGMDVVADWKARATAHLSEGKDRCEFELFVEKYFGLPENVNENYVVPGADFGQLVNMLAMFHNEQLAAAQARVLELEEWKRQQMEMTTPIMNYCADNSERLGVNLGRSIFKRVLEILKEYKAPSKTGIR